MHTHKQKFITKEKRVLLNLLRVQSDITYVERLEIKRKKTHLVDQLSDHAVPRAVDRGLHAVVVVIHQLEAVLETHLLGQSFGQVYGVPCNRHPAVLGRLSRGNHAATFTVSLPDSVYLPHR